MNEYYVKFLELLEKEDRYECIKYVNELLKNNKIGIVDLYQNVLRPSLENMTCKLSEKHMCIWQEHIRSSIVRTIVENCYTYVIDESIKSNYGKKGKVVVLCPPEEYHEIGARMVTDLFTISGYEAIFVGSNTPKSDFLSAVEFIEPDYIAISVSNYYNLFAAKDAIDNIKSNIRKKVTIIAGGNAFKSNIDSYKKIGADIFVDTFEDIQTIGGV
jgi:MerR family transcriptional regulator, light-induced transcriptional regulator